MNLAKLSTDAGVFDAVILALANPPLFGAYPSLISLIGIAGSW
jgi:hypothetical protein